MRSIYTDAYAFTLVFVHCFHSLLVHQCLLVDIRYVLGTFSFTCIIKWQVTSVRQISMFNMLNCFKHYKRDIQISYHILDVFQLKRTRFTMQQLYKLSILYCQYHSWWCSGDLWSQGINRHGIDQISCNVPSLASEKTMLQWKLPTNSGKYCCLLSICKKAYIMNQWCY